MPIYELGYRHDNGPRRSPLHRALAITRHGARLAFQIKSLQRMVWLSLAGVMYYALLLYIVAKVTEPSTLRMPANQPAWQQHEHEPDEEDWPKRLATGVFGYHFTYQLNKHADTLRLDITALLFHHHFSRVQAIVLLIVAGLAGSPLIAKDMRDRAFLLYFAKPISRWTYLTGKLGVVMLFALSITLLPILLMYLMSIALAPSLAAVGQTLPLLGMIMATTLPVSLVASLVVLAFSSLTSSHHTAQFLWLAWWVMGEVFYRALSAYSDGPWFLFSPYQVIRVISENVYGVAQRTATVEALVPLGRGQGMLGWLLRGSGHSSLPAWALLVALSVASVLIIRRRVSAPMRI
jgi:ABC-type transport system involved in multi-copper enzyme maturation permease subunit